MENGKQMGSPYSSSSSFTNDLFGSKDSPTPSSPNGIFSSIFPPPSAVSFENCFIFLGALVSGFFMTFFS